MARSYPREAARNVLVIAPHPDDDAIGCGGTLARLARYGARISVVYVTDGGASHPRSARFPPPVLRAVREGEARRALRCLGIFTQPHFLRTPDGGLRDIGAAQRRAVICALRRRISTLHPRMVFAPWPRDPHPDHVATTELVHAALAASARQPPLFYYGVWMLVRGDADARPAPEARFDEVRLRRGELARKRAAIAAHRSQAGALVDDDPDGFTIDAQLLRVWLGPVERFYRAQPPG